MSDNADRHACFDAFERFDQWGEEKVRIQLATGTMGKRKAQCAELWLEDRALARAAMAQALPWHETGWGKICVSVASNGITAIVTGGGGIIIGYLIGRFSG